MTGTPDRDDEAAHVRRLLDLSTEHVSREAEEWLEEAATATGAFGWLIGQRDPEFANDDAWPPSLTPIFALALAHDCQWILFDADAPTHPDLPIWVDDEGEQRTEAEGPYTDDQEAAAP